MENRIIAQFNGFLNTFPLWEGMGPFAINQFTSPPNTSPLPQENELLDAIPSLSRNFVLGKRMEGFFSYVISNSAEFNLIAENLQIAQDKITIGEIDFIVEDKRGKNILHVELVYKFYVYDPSFEIEDERWIGPNRRDSLLQKIKKLRNQQFPLIFKKETNRTLTALKIAGKELKQMVCFKANLFIPKEMKGQRFPLINNSCICGYWIHLHQFNPAEFSENLFFAPKKTDWPIDPEANEEWVSFSKIYGKVKELHEKKFSPLLWMKTFTGEVESFFVVWW